MSKPATIGFIGLGNMGVGFTRRLAACGNRVVGYDIDPARTRAAGAWGVVAAASPAEVARAADLILVCVISTDAVEAVVLGESGVASIGPATGKVLVDHSTTDLDATCRIAAELKRRTGMAFVDAPVSGGPGAAEQGTLAIMAGGDETAIEAVRPVMEQVAARFTRMGEVGAGQATKLVNQTLVLSSYAVIAEAVNLGRKLGIDVSRIPHALGTGYAGSRLLDDLLPRMVAHDFAPRGYARQVLKDLEMVGAAASRLKAPMPMAAQTTSLYRLLLAHGKGELDGSAIVTLLEGDAEH